jgi:hypothetical protein
MSTDKKTNVCPQYDGADVPCLYEDRECLEAGPYCGHALLAEIKQLKANLTASLERERELQREVCFTWATMREPRCWRKEIKQLAKEYAKKRSWPDIFESEGK